MSVELLHTTAFENSVQQEKHAALLKIAWCLVHKQVTKEQLILRNCVKPTRWSDRSPLLPLSTTNWNFAITITKYLPLTSDHVTFGTYCTTATILWSSSLVLSRQFSFTSSSICASCVNPIAFQSSENITDFRAFLSDEAPHMQSNVPVTE
jgi:hypothetical protein